jgi:uncharacterized protein (DUF302 family)
MSAQYGFKKKLNISFEEALEKTTAAMKEEGFGVLTEIDVKATLKKKLDTDFRRYVILGACNPPFAYKALQTELEIGLLLPCNVIVYETEDGGSVVSAINPMAAMGIVDNPEMQEVAEQVTQKIRRAVDSLDA